MEGIISKSEATSSRTSLGSYSYVERLVRDKEV